MQQEVTIDRNSLGYSKVELRKVDYLMKKKTVLAALSLSLVVGLAGVVNAAPNSAYMTAQHQVSEEQAYMNNQDALITEAEGAIQEEATQEATTSEEATAVNDQTAQEMTDIHGQMLESGPVMAKQMQKMQGQGTSIPKEESTQQGQKSSSNAMMGSMN